MHKKLLAYLNHEPERYSITPNHIATVVILLGFAFRVLVLHGYGNSLSLASDDEGYIQGAINLLKTGQLTYSFGHPGPMEQTMLIMPGIQLLLALLFKIYGYTQSAILWTRFVFILIGCFGMVGLYKVGKKLFGATTALIATAMWALWPPAVLADNLILTETPFITLMLWFIWYAIKYCDTKSDADLLMILLFWYAGFMFRSTIALMPILFTGYYFAKRFPIKKLIVRGGASVAILLALLMPWWVRNYLITGDFVAATSSSGVVLLAGTFHGDDYPVIELASFSWAPFLIVGEENAQHHQMRRMGEYARRRIQYWWQTDRQSFLETYLIKKPRDTLKNVWWSLQLLEIHASTFNNIQVRLLWLALASVVLMCFIKQKRQSALLCLLFVLYGLLLCIIFLPLSRYFHPFVPFVFLLVAAFFAHVCSAVKFLISGIKWRHIFSWRWLSAFPFFRGIDV